MHRRSVSKCLYHTQAIVKICHSVNRDRLSFVLPRLPFLFRIFSLGLSFDRITQPHYLFFPHASKILSENITLDIRF